MDELLGLEDQLLLRSDRAKEELEALRAQIDAFQKCLRATAPSVATIADSCNVWVDRSKFTVGLGTKSCFLGNTKEFALFDFLNKRRGGFIPWKDLAVEVWGDSVNVEQNTVQKFLSTLRGKLREVGIHSPRKQDLQAPLPPERFLVVDGGQKGHYRLIVLPST